MILVLLGVFGVIFGILLNMGCDFDDAPCGVTGVLTFLSLAAAIFIAIGVSNGSHLDEKIDMYSTENKKIEVQIAEIVQNYQEYEKGIFEEVSPDNAVTLVTLYPELKSNELVTSQINIYVKNSEKIKELKEQQIDTSVLRWWLYFGS